MKNFDNKEYEGLIKRSKIYWTKRTDINWGDYSQINCELILLKEATKCKHSYYHLISGVDLPLKRQNEIHDFFAKYNGLEFVDEDYLNIREDLFERVNIYHILCDKKGKRARQIKSASKKKQSFLKIDRLKKHRDICFQKGRNWFSITHDLAVYIVKNEKWIRKLFRASECGDEMFLQTVVRNSEFQDRICNHITMPEVPDTRYIDWKRGTPYIFCEEDYMELKTAKGLFARKFDINVDSKIIDMIFEDLK